MIVNYLTNTTLKNTDALYEHDDNVNLKNKKIFIDGRLSVNASPVFEGLSDYKRNNYSLMFLTKQTNLPDVTDFYTPLIREDFFVGKIFVIYNNNYKYLKFDASIDDQEFLTINYDQSFNNLSQNEPLNIFHFIKKTDTICNIMYRYGDNDYYLNFNPVTINLNFTILSAFNDLKEYTRDFYYTQNNETGIITLQCRIQGRAYRVTYNQLTNRLALSTLQDISLTDTRCIFYLTGNANLTVPEITIDWASYEKSFNQNNLSINSEKTFYNTKNNFLIHSEYLKSNVDTELKYNFLNLKNQLNIEGYSTRGNCFLQEDSITNREYVTIFSGGRQEKGYDKLHLQYQTYTYPYKFKPGKTTWFHTPQSMWPYERININNTSLIDAGAVGGDHPLRSDKIFKKIGNYSETSNSGNSTSEHTGQWLCSWLSAAPDITVKPVWVDRFFNPSKLTPFQAISATPGFITYQPSYSSYLKDGIYDAPSSLTFEPGGLYAYTRIGKNDAQENIKSLQINLENKNFTTYVTLDNKKLQPSIQSNITTYTFDGNNYATIDVSQFNNALNTFTISFWASRDNWAVPCGYQIIGNFTDYGLGFFNYEFVTPLLMYIVNNNSINAYNSNLELVNSYDLNNLSNNNIINFCRRDPLNSFHIFTSLSSVYEMNLQEAIIDMAPLTGQPIDIVNNANDAYIIFNNTPLVGKLNLLSNVLQLTAARYLNTLPPNTLQKNRLIIDNNSAIYVLSTFNNTTPRVIKNSVYFLNKKQASDTKGTLSVWDINTGTFTPSSVLNSTGLYDVFNIDKNNNIWCVSGNNIDIFGQFGIFKKTFTFSRLLSSNNSTIQNIVFAENFVNGVLEESVFLTCSASNKMYITKINENGEDIKTISLDNTSFCNIDPSNYNYNLSYSNTLISKYSFQARLYNPFNTEDSTILNLPVLSEDLNPGFHHFTITVNSFTGEACLYLDGEKYSNQNFEPGVYAFTSVAMDNLIAGATPFYNNTLLNTFLTKNKNTIYYTIKDFSVQNFYWINRELGYFDINMFYKEKIEPDILVWDIPAGRRFYFDTIARYFTNQIPGAKSGLLNVYIKTDLLDDQCRGALEPEIIKTVTSALPAYAKLNKLIWSSETSTTSAALQQPNYIGNVITNAGLQR